MATEAAASQSSKATPGTWSGKLSKQADDDGNFRRQTAGFRDTISNEPDAKFRPEKGRYFLIANLLCPWANRALIVRGLKKLEDDIDVFYVGPSFGPHGWYFSGKDLSAPKDPIFGKEHLRDVYLAVDPDYNQRYTIPILFDRKHKTIVNNESSEIIRMLNDWPSTSPDVPDLYPQDLRPEIDEINEWVYETVNNGVYKTFASTQEAYEANVRPLFASLDRLEKLLANGERQFLVGPGKGQLTEADVRLYPTLARFDVAYHYMCRCNIRKIREYPHLYAYLRRLYHTSEFEKVTDFDHIKRGYAGSAKREMDKETIVPLGPENPID